jgi:tetratricopeptide (TPR) repeat protein
MNQGESANTQGDYGRAAAKVQGALTIIREVGDRMKELSMLINLGEAQVKSGDYDMAVANLTLVIAQTPKDWTYAPVAHLALAEGYLGQGKVDQALAAVQTVGAMEQINVDPYCMGCAWRVLGRIAARLGRPTALQVTSDVTYSASDCFIRSLQKFTDSDNRREQAVSLWEWAKYEFGQGDRALGQVLWQEAREMFARLHLPLMIDQMETNPDRQ